MSQSFHMTVSLSGGLRMSDRELRGMLKQGDRELTPEECRTLFIQKLREGFDVLPMCSHHDEKGHCLGHEEDPAPAVARGTIGDLRPDGTYPLIPDPL